MMARGRRKAARTGAGWWVRQTVSWLVLFSILAVLLAAVVVPRRTGSSAYTVLTMSMRPSLSPGTLVITKPVAPADLKVGDAVTYQIHSGAPDVVTHRITSVSPTLGGELLFTTQGDANPAADEKAREGRTDPRRRLVQHAPGRFRQQLAFRRAKNLGGGNNGCSAPGLLGVHVDRGGRRSDSEETPYRSPADGGGAMKRRGAAAVGMGLVLACSTAVPAAATDGLLFSADGQTWDEGLSQPLFGRHTLVPGDQVSGTFWVRNGSPDRADLSVAVVGSGPALLRQGRTCGSRPHRNRHRHSRPVRTAPSCSVCRGWKRPKAERSPSPSA